MPSQLLPAGASLDKPPRYAALHTNEFWTGLWTNGNPLRDRATPYLYQKFYSATRNEAMLGGVNVELSSRLTPIRRPGNSVYNSVTFPPIDDFYSFRIFNPTTFAETIAVMADTANEVFDATGPSTAVGILTKSSGAGQTSFQSIGNTLYMADGIDQKKWIYRYFPWQPDTPYSTGYTLIDSNGVIQEVVGAQIGGSASGFINPKVYIIGNVGTIVWTGPFDSSQLQQLPGSSVSFAGFVGASFLNGNSANVISAVNLGEPLLPSASITFAFTHANYGPTADVGLVTISSGTGSSGATTPPWNTFHGGKTPDGTLVWKNDATPVIDWQPIGPTAAPNVANTINAAQSSWAASTYFWASQSIEDTNSNLQLLTTAGTTASSPPSWNATVGGTTTDGTAVWTNQGPVAWIANHAYAPGSYVVATFTVSVPSTLQTGSARGGPMIVYVSVTYTNLFFTSAGGTSGATTPSWASGVGTQISDNGVTWVNQGAKITRTASATSSSNIGNSTAVSLLTQVVDATGYAQNVTIGGLSGSSAPTWNETNGGSTTDNQITWTNGGPLAAANTGSWVYGYAFKNSVTGGVSQCSPTSQPVILNLDSYITVSGGGDPNWNTDGVDTIQIYRSVQGQTTLFWLAEIPSPLLGAGWTYSDTSPDPPNPTSTLNEFISADVVGNNSPPPQGITGLAYYLSRMFGIVGEFIYWSGAPQGSVGVNTDNWNLSNYFQMPSVVIKLWPSAQGLLIFTNQGIYLSSGTDGNGNPSQPVPLLQDVGLLTPNCFAVNGSIPLIFTSDQQFISLDPSSGVSRIGFPIEDLLAGFNPQNSYVAWHTKGGDQAAYICDGSTGWYRINLTPAPETGGYTWSPKATIVTGVKCIKSIETSPGVKDLLLGPSATGAILRRDATMNMDAFNPYPAYFVIGNVVLSQPGQAAEVAFITTEAVAIGSHPAIAILCDEIAASGGQGFETITTTTNDPYWAAASNTVYSDRWYLDGDQQPKWMRHCQVMFTWPAENEANELLTYTFFAALHSED